MLIVPGEPDAPGYEAETYECPNCKFSEALVVRC
jgi:hypothetical protein